MHLGVTGMPLCRVEIDVPRQIRSLLDWDIHADVWFPPQEISIMIEDESRILRFGFRQAALILETDQRLALRNHFEVEAAAVDVELQSSAGKDSSSSRGGGIFIKLFKIFGGNFSVKRETRAGTSDKRVEKISEKRFVVQSIDNNVWLVSGIECPFGVLAGRAVRAEPLCSIQDVAEKVDFRVTVTAPLNQLWTAIIDENGSSIPDDDQFNRLAVVQSLIGRSLRRGAAARVEGVEPATIPLCKSKFSIIREHGHDC